MESQRRQDARMLLCIWLPLLCAQHVQAQSSFMQGMCPTLQRCTAFTNKCACGTCNTHLVNECEAECGQCGTPHPSQYVFVGERLCADSNKKSPQYFSQQRAKETNDSTDASWCETGCSRYAACVAYDFDDGGLCWLYGNGLNKATMQAQGWEWYAGDGGSDAICTVVWSRDAYTAGSLDVCYRKTATASATTLDCLRPDYNCKKKFGDAATCVDPTLYTCNGEMTGWKVFGGDLCEGDGAYDDRHCCSTGKTALKSTTTTLQTTASREGGGWRVKFHLFCRVFSSRFILHFIDCCHILRLCRILVVYGLCSVGVNVQTLAAVCRAFAGHPGGTSVDPSEFPKRTTPRNGAARQAASRTACVQTTKVETELVTMGGQHAAPLSADFITAHTIHVISIPRHFLQKRSRAARSKSSLSSKTSASIPYGTSARARSSRLVGAPTSAQGS